MSENGLKEPEPLTISGIQHFSFCRRQWALIHVENQWIENIHTTDGMIFHQRVHDDKELEINNFRILGLQSGISYDTILACQIKIKLL